MGRPCGCCGPHLNYHPSCLPHLDAHFVFVTNPKFNPQVSLLFGVDPVALCEHTLKRLTS